MQKGDDDEEEAPLRKAMINKFDQKRRQAKFKILSWFQKTTRILSVFQKRTRIINNK